MAGNKLVRFVARASMIAGLGVGVVAVLFWTVGSKIEPTPWLLRIAVAKFGLAMAASMVVTGAIVLRSLKQWDRRKAERAEPSPPDESARALGAASWNPEWRQREQEPQRITTPPELHAP